MAPPERVVTLNSDIFKCIHKVTVLPLSNSAESRKLLTRAAEEVKPIMAKHKWTVPLLEEFYPPQPNLLGMNHGHGAKIQVRTRSPGNPDVFLPYDNILGTLLHELVHNDIGPHNDQFYKLLDVLNEELHTLKKKADPGPGRTTGLRAVPRVQAAQMAAAAAQKRLTVRALMSAKPTALGGASAAGTNPREMAVNAAIRRLQDDKWCPTGGLAEQEQQNSGKDTENGENDVEIIDVDAIPQVIDVDAQNESEQVPLSTPVPGTGRQGASAADNEISVENEASTRKPKVEDLRNFPPQTPQRQQLAELRAQAAARRAQTQNAPAPIQRQRRTQTQSSTRTQPANPVRGREPPLVQTRQTPAAIAAILRLHGGAGG